ncbi:hypothetical protein PQ478_08660 [Alkalihalophilus pseudofirmus]|uniref:hypothetical protein n=1 Tax=Alkalihalophilus pseudofirmus TaxID=79885 RepID=UPI00259B0705|nr:hypothetical protein [Alkalihalophilus pseudofirmus]WEG18540.1 hypothetical protein PQ478_08660 [Alkalihalophilus pseudofirmus]
MLKSKLIKSIKSIALAIITVSTLFTLSACNQSQTEQLNLEQLAACEECYVISHIEDNTIKLTDSYDTLTINAHELVNTDLSGLKYNNMVYYLYQDGSMIKPYEAVTIYSASIDQIVSTDQTIEYYASNEQDGFYFTSTELLTSDKDINISDDVLLYFHTDNTIDGLIRVYKGN